jgi:HTH-type transcriptional regulator/antitoxin HipB
MAMKRIMRNKNDLGEAIRRTRRSMGLRQIDVAQKASVRQALVSDIENGATTAKLDTVIRVLAALDMDLSIVPRRDAAFDPTKY